MTSTAVDRPNRDKLQHALDLYRDEMREFIIRNLKRVRGTNVNQLLLDAAARNPDVYQRREQLLRSGKDPKSVIDVGDFPHIVARHWNEVFRNNSSTRAGMRNRLYIITEARHRVAHPDEGDIDFGYTVGRLSDIKDVLDDINAPTSAVQVSRAIEALGSSNGSMVPGPREPLGGASAEDSQSDAPIGKSNGLKPWREVIEPHVDVTSGDITNHTFAADLQRVADAKTAYDEYTSPVRFFHTSFVTPGMQWLLVNTVKRINALGGEPVIQMKTGFGGGKTHSLIALYHLVNSSPDLAVLATDPSEPTGEALRQVFTRAGVEPVDSNAAKVAVLSGTVRSATESTSTKEGDPLNTLWGYMAYELGGQPAYDIVREASEQWSAPGGQELNDLFAYVGPCVILIDELVAYARNLSARQDASFYTFLQALTETAGRRNDVAIVATVPEAESEMGGAHGVAAQSKIEHVLARVEAVSAPLGTHEAFEVVRRRLFEDSGVDEEALTNTANAFYTMYTRSKKEFPDHASSSTYLELLTRCYPIHPEVFDRLSDDWSEIHQFQRTRGVLRLMAIAIKRLKDTSNDHLIMPGSLPLDDTTLNVEFTKVLSGNWDPAIKELDGTNSRADAVDQAVPRFARYGGGAAKRVARTIFLGSVPGSQSGQTVTGITEDHIRLGTTQPGEGVAVYNEARNRLTRELYHLHASEDHYFIHTNPNLLKVHEDVARNIDVVDADEQIRRMINESMGARIDDDVRVVPFPTDTADIPDDQRLKLVILHPTNHLPSRASDVDNATDFAREALNQHGELRRIRRNMIVFLAAKRDNIVDLRGEATTYLAWDRLAKESNRYNLNIQQIQKALEERSATHDRIETRILNAYREVIAPVQPDPTTSEYRFAPFSVNKIQAGNVVARAISALKEREHLVVEIGHRQFDSMLNEHFWKPGVDHIEIREVWDCLTEQVHMHRLLNRTVLDNAVRHAITELDYEEASNYSPEHGYVRPVRTSLMMDSSRLLVRGEAFRASLELQLGRQGNHPVGPTPDPPDDDDDDKDESQEDTTKPDRITRLTAKTTLIGQPALERDYNKMRNDLAKAMDTLGGNVTVTITIEASNHDGFPDLGINTIKQNGEQLGFSIGTAI